MLIFTLKKKHPDPVTRGVVYLFLQKGSLLYIDLKSQAVAQGHTTCYLLKRKTKIVLKNITRKRKV